MADSPKPDGANGRNSDGTFAKGNGGGPGNPQAKKIAEYRRKIREAFNGDEIVGVMQNMAKIASGDAKDRVAAARVFLEYTVGKPKESVELEAGGQPLVFNIVSAKRRKDGDDE